MSIPNKTLASSRIHRAQGILKFSRSTNVETTVFYSRGGLFQNSWLAPLQQRKNSRHFLVMDRNIEKIYGSKVLAFLKQNGLKVKEVVIAPGERSKSLSVYKRLISSIATSGVDRDSYILALGGGVVNNVAGFFASTLYRGIGLIQIPTTLLAQLDAAIDFKQAINSPYGKNQLGSYYSASAVVVDPDLLQTLPIRQLRSGLGEAIKHALIEDQQLFSYLEDYPGDLRDKEFLDDVIVRTVQLKVLLLNKSHDEKDLEMLPQYGHAVGHALEHLSHYKLLHGEAIAIGMCVMSEIANVLGVSSAKVMEKHYQIMSKFKLPTIIPNYISDQSILAAIRHDKYFLRSLRSVLTSNVGSIANVAEDPAKYVFNIESKVIETCLLRNRDKALINQRAKIWTRKN